MFERISASQAFGPVRRRSPGLHRAGVSAVENVVVLAAVVAVCLISVAAMGRFQKSAFARLGSEAYAGVAGKSPPGLPVAVADPAIQSRPATSPWLLGLATTGCFALGIGVTVFIALKKRRADLLAIYAARQLRPKRQSDPAVIKRRMFEKRSRINQILNSRWESVARGEILVGDLMTSALKTIGPDTPRDAVVRLMGTAEMHHLLVVDETNHLLGIISDRDILGRDGTTAAALMTADPDSVSPCSDIRQAMTLMLIRRFSAVPVVDEGRLAGILTTNDLVATLHCTLSRLSEIAQLLQSEKGRTIVQRALTNCEADACPEENAPLELLVT
jgi:acetoin utilization protein AcuB